ncbi:STAS/SEC14 domain-containing protein [Hymenobacter sp. ASUV-10]|uniref:STAS/SEC14 domain-containing protein n=1 Tax=Hymenobacter aranciens TaxID=3063996 RepID=A0ABT9B5E7_9BACT|nr:STAS/SEC14 domain-containing protein [Hymenobacter sp. ASUV-10]MDO7873484.1 STAS/SEC14 domain-containing protein [Hymenobacter sp. ASUV-10]
MPATHRTVYFENAAGRIWTEPAGYLRLDYHAGRRQETDFRALLTHLRQAMSRHGGGRVLINQRQMAGFSPAEERWMIGEWLPRAVQDNGYRSGAVLVADDVFARLAMSNVAMATHHLGHEYRNFSDEGEAVAWLLA